MFRMLSLVAGTILLAHTAAAAPTPSLRYHFVDLDAAPGLPGMAFFFPARVTNRGWVYGSALVCPDPNNFDTCVGKVAVYRNGAMSALADGGVFDANEGGLVGGDVLTDPVNYIEQAALFKDGRTTLIPRLPDEYSSHVIKVTDTGVALVESIDGTTFQRTYYLYDKGGVRPLDLGSGQVGFLDINDRLQVAGTAFDVPGKGSRAFRFDSLTKRMTLLEPLATEPSSWGQGINARGDVLGYSFAPGHLERIGAWLGTAFRTAFVEGTPQLPTVSDRLRWNERGLIAVSLTNDHEAYLVPAPGVRLKLGDLVDHPLGSLPYIGGVNEPGDLIGVDFAGTVPDFLLQRVPANSAAARPAAVRRPSVALGRLPSRLVAFLRHDLAVGRGHKSK